MGPDAMILVFWMLSFKPTFSLSSFTFMKRLFSFLRFLPKGWCYLHIWGYWYFSWQSGFQLVFSFSPAFCMKYSSYKLNKQGDNIQPWHTLFLIWNQSVVPCPVLTAASGTCIQISQEAGKVVWYSHLFKNFPQFVVIHTVKDFGVVNKAKVNVLLELSCRWWLQSWN